MVLLTKSKLVRLRREIQHFSTADYLICYNGHAVKSVVEKPEDFLTKVQTLAKFVKGSFPSLLQSKHQFPLSMKSYLEKSFQWILCGQILTLFYALEILQHDSWLQYFLMTAVRAFEVLGELLSTHGVQYTLVIQTNSVQMLDRLSTRLKQDS